ncbi:ABC transporter substrate-binding protein [Vibrio sp. JC009]|uniref:ABC transporter substrate-binding protein n=1 Tax=Vibrio sp. JC009 TaxID=2912314 RepID=UPI0023B0DA4B|nr:ABC transporter substrate-binding protein [Vibrio sp. JC009]WED23923.1 ABC transporter substrate-binding protein [Vibrio sp. JC009]
MRYKRLITLFILGLFSLGINAADKLDKITMASPFAPLVMPMAYILENGLLDDIAEKTELKIWNTPDQLRSMMTTGSVDFASVPSNVASIFYNKGVKLKMVDVSIWGVMYIVSSDDKIKSLADMKGQSIYVPFRGDQPDLVFQTIAESQGFDPLKDFEVQYVNSPLDIVMGLLAGQIKNALLIEPVSSMVIMKGKAKGVQFERVIDIQKELGKIEGWKNRFPNAGVVALPPVMQNPETIDAFAKAYEQAVKWTVANPGEAAKLAAKHVPGVNAAAFQESLKYTNFTAIRSATAKDEMENMFKAFISLNPKSVGGKLPDDGFYYQ